MTPFRNIWDVYTSAIGSWFYWIPIPVNNTRLFCTLNTICIHACNLFYSGKQIPQEFFWLSKLIRIRRNSIFITDHPIYWTMTEFTEQSLKKWKMPWINAIPEIAGDLWPLPKRSIPDGMNQHKLMLQPFGMEPQLNIISLFPWFHVLKE